MMSLVNLDATATRKLTVTGTLPQFVSRWSPRAMSGEALTFDDIAPLFEAARWAPSSYNAQPWRLLYALRDDAYWQTYFDLLVEGNQLWVRNAGALLVIVSRHRFERNGKDSVTHSFDSGAAWMSLALQAHHLGIVAHGMQGFDYNRAASELKVPEEFTVEAMVALGRPGLVTDLPESYREREVPSDRKPLDEIVIHGAF